MLRIDLSQHFTNYKKNCIIIIRDEWTTIKDLQNHVKDIYELKKIEFTNIDNCWIPGSEPIHIIKTDQSEELIGVGIKVKEHKSIDKTNNNNLNQNFPGKHQKSHNITNNDNMQLSRKRKITNCSSKESIIIDNPFRLPVKSKNFEKSPKSIRKRNKKNKKLNENSNDNEDVLDSIAVKSTTSKLPEEELLKQHLRFDENGNAMIEGEQKQLNFKNWVDTLHPTKPRIFSTIIVKNKNSTDTIVGCNNNDDNQGDTDDTYENNEKEKNNVIIKENKIINNGFELLKNAICQPRVEITDIRIKEHNNKKSEEDIIVESDDDVEIIKPVKYNDINEIYQCEDKLSKILSISQTLIGPPKVDDILFFKKFALNDKYEPGLSNYICGKIEQINDENFVKIYIIAGQDELRGPLGKFSLDSTVNENTSHLDIELKELLEPRSLKQNFKNLT